MNSLSNAMRTEANSTYTENGAKAYGTTNSSLLDLFSVIGALRNRPDSEIERLFDKAFKEEPLYALKCVFYARDIRGGLGERDVPRKLLKHLAETNPCVVATNMQYIPHFGRWDDLYVFVGTPVEHAMWQFMRKQFEEDFENLTRYEKGEKEALLKISLLAKWIKTPDSKSRKTRSLGAYTAIKLGYEVYRFKRILRKLRKALRIVERDICAKTYENIAYSGVPSLAMLKYRKQFMEHDSKRFKAYIEAVSACKSHMNTATLYPYDILRAIVLATDEDEINMLETQWRELPNYADSDDSVIVMADVSGSMAGLPVLISTSLAIYFAQRNKGAFHNLFMTFSGRPSFVDISRYNGLYETYREARNADWDMSTDFVAAMREILNLCVKNKVPPEDVPKAIICITDMEFDAACCAGNQTYISEMLESEYTKLGYKMPKIIFWNANSRNNVWHAKSDMPNTMLVSGSSASTFKTVIECIDYSPMETMYKTLDNSRYACIKLE